MSGLQVTVRQIGNYPAAAAARADDLVLLQQGGLGGPYVTTTPQGLLAPLASASLAVGLATPPEWTRGHLAAQYHVLPSGGDILWNAWRGPSGYRTWLGGMAARLTFSPATGGLAFGLAPAQNAGQPVTAFLPAMTLDGAGQLRLHAGTLQVARDPGKPNEVATMGWVNRATVRSFNGRSGAVRLEVEDLHRVLGLADDRIATENGLQATINNLLTRHPFVWAFNGRSGNIWLSLDDVMGEFFRPGAAPSAPTPPFLDNSGRIATTAWVSKFVWERLWPDIAGHYAPIDSPQFRGIPTGPQPATDSNDGQLATTEWVKSTLADIGAGVLQWNGRSGFVTLQLSDVNAVFTAFGAVPLTNTAAPGTNTQQIASTAFVTAATQQIIDNSVWTFNTRKGNVVLALQDILDADGQAVTSLATSAPAALADGQFWFDPATNVLNIWDGAAWTAAGGVVEISDTVPATEYPGKLWWSSTTGDLYIYFEGASGGQWVVASTAAGTAGPPGQKGDKGDPGIQGTPGPGLRPMGNVADLTALAALPGPHQQGDLYVVTANGHAYAWSDALADWVDLGVVGAGMPDAPDDGPLYGRQAAGGVSGAPMGWAIVIDDGQY